MNKLKVCFVGVGSIARRHIINMHQVCKTRGIELIADAFRREKNDVEGVSRIFTDISAVPSDYDVIFITNPTEYHLESLLRFHDKGMHFFIEKPVVSLGFLKDAKEMDLRKDSIYYVASPLRYNAVIEWIKNNIDIHDVYSVRSISSSYLPDWRPGKDYRDTYSAHKDMGGGVSIDLIHEWDYLTFLFGFPDRVFSMIGKVSNLELESDDYAIYIAEYSKMTVELHLDYYGRKTIRQIMIFTKNETILGDIENNKVYYLKTGDVVDFKENRNDYQKRELDHFIDMISGIADIEDGYHHGLDVLALTQGQL